MAALPLARHSLASLAERKDRAAIVADARMVVAANQPATAEELGRVIFGLLILYPEFDRRSEQSKAMVVEQWRRSLSGWPVDVLEAAAQGWVNGARASFLPQPGDVVTVCVATGAFRRAMAEKAAAFLAGAARI